LQQQRQQPLSCDTDWAGGPGQKSSTFWVRMGGVYRKKVGGGGYTTVTVGCQWQCLWDN